MRTSCRSISTGQQTTDNSGQHVHATQWLPRPSSRKNDPDTIRRVIDKDRHMKIIGGDFKARTKTKIAMFLSRKIKMNRLANAIKEKIGLNSSKGARKIT